MVGDELERRIYDVVVEKSYAIDGARIYKDCEKLKQLYQKQLDRVQTELDKLNNFKQEIRLKNKNELLDFIEMHVSKKEQND
jgi:hypothetical protein